MAEEKSIFDILSAIDVSEKTKQKLNLTYLPWASAWAIVKKIFPDAKEDIIPQIMDDRGNTRPWHDDGKTGWVETKITIHGETETETLPVMDHRNNSIPADKITSFDANKANKRCLVKCLARFGLGLNLFYGEDVPEEVSRLKELQGEIMDIITKKCAIETAKEKVAALCKETERSLYPDRPEDEINGDPRTFEDIDALEKLKRKLLAIRK